MELPGRLPARMRSLRIGANTIGPGAPVFIIAEAGVNHNARPELALRLAEEAAAAGADAIKFQTYSAEQLVTRTAPKYYVDTLEQWQRQEPPTGYQIDEFAQLDHLSPDAYRAVAAACRRSQLTFLSTPFDEASADFLDELEVLAFKIASADITNHRLLRHVAAKGKPMLLSTGCSTLGEIQEALDVMREVGNADVALMHCTLSYPTAAQDANLNMMKTMQAVFPTHPVGFSDHTLGIVAPSVAVSHGARLIEKHFTLDKTLGTSTDHFMSVDPAELRQMVQAIREAEVLMGLGEKGPVPAEEAARRYARRSIVTRRPIVRDAIIAEADLTLKRPGTGLPPKYVDLVVGRRAHMDIAADTVLTWEMIR